MKLALVVALLVSSPGAPGQARANAQRLQSAEACATVFVGHVLYAGGGFTIAGGVAARRIARWDGTSWSPVGSGISDGSVSALAGFDDAGGPTLQAGGSFYASPEGDSYLAKWGTSRKVRQVDR